MPEEKEIPTGGPQSAPKQEPLADTQDADTPAPTPPPPPTDPGATTQGPKED
jgi:hypothetical protein